MRHSRDEVESMFFRKDWKNFLASHELYLKKYVTILKGMGLPDASPDTHGFACLIADLDIESLLGIYMSLEDGDITTNITELLKVSFFGNKELDALYNDFHRRLKLWLERSLEDEREQYYKEGGDWDREL